MGPNAFAAYLCLCRHVNDDSTAVVPMRQIAWEIGVSLGTAKRSINRLERLDLILVNERREVDGGRGPHEYVLLEFPEEFRSDWETRETPPRGMPAS